MLLWVLWKKLSINHIIKDVIARLIVYKKVYTVQDICVCVCLLLYFVDNPDSEK